MTSQKQDDLHSVTSKMIAAAKKVHEYFRDGWYRPSKELEAFEHSCRILELFHKQVSGVREQNMLEVTGIRTRLEDAVKLLNYELKRCRSRTKQSQFHCWSPSSRSLAFPQELALVLQGLVQKVTSIPGFELHAGGAEEVEHAPAKLPFGPDSKYVPLAETLAAVVQALEDEVCSPVVVIHGEPGTGKSSLVKHLGLAYQGSDWREFGGSSSVVEPSAPASSPTRSPRRSHGSPSSSIPLLSPSRVPSVPQLLRKSFGTRSSTKKPVTILDSEPVSPSSKSSQITPLSGEVSPNGRVAFQHGIFFIHCGQGADVQSKQLELSKILGLRFTTPKDETWQQKPPFSLRCQSLLRKHLRKRLNNQRALIVLDDVWEADLVEKLIMPGIQVKFLVTSQNSDVWEGTKMIEIGRVTLEEARKILAHHIGFESGIIPVSLMEVADGLIEAANHNPLALVNMALAIKAVHTPGAVEVRQWNAVVTNFEKEIEIQSSKERFGLLRLQIGSYLPCRASMLLALESMPKEALRLLIFTLIFDSLYVPEVVVRLLYSRISRCESLSKFFRWKGYLEAWSLISVEGQSVAGTQETVDRLQFCTWIVHGLRKQLIIEMEMENMTSIINQLTDDCASAQDSEHERIIAALCYIYGSPMLSRQVSEKLGLPSVDRKAFKRNVIEPFVYMLHPDGDEDWKQSSNDLATKVILNFLFLNELDDNSLAQLLQIPQVVDIVCKALCVFGEQSTRSSVRLPLALEQTVKGLVDLFAESESIMTQRVSLDAFISLTQFDTSRKSKNLVTLANSSGALQHLERMLADSKDPICQCRAAGVLGNISQYHEMAVEKLMGLMSSGKPERIQRCASSAFASLALTNDNKPKLNTFVGVLRSLVDLLDRDVPESVQWPAAVALVNLSMTDENRIRMVQFPGVLEKLVDLLDRDVAEVVQHYAAWALANLAAAEGNQVQMAKCPNLLSRLLANLDDDVPENVQFQAARALGNLSRAHENHVLMAIFPNALERFVNLLAKDVPRSIQEHAAKAFACLSAADDNKVIMATSPNVLASLVGLLHRNVSAEVQLYAVWALANLAVADENRSRLASAPGALQMLVGLLARDVPESIQQHAARAFANLASAQENKANMAFFPGAVEGIVGLLDRCVSPGVQLSAVLAFAKLAMVDDDKVKSHMATLDGSIEALVDLLSGDVPEKIQQYAAWAFASLALEKQNKEMMATHPGALENLLGLLSDDVNGSVQRQAARALTILEWEVCIDPFLKSPESLIGRGSVRLDQGKYVDALADFNRANELRPGHEEILWLRAFARVKSTFDCQGALEDLDRAVDIAPDRYLSWQERGVLKHMMGDLQGALADLDRAIEISRNNYEVLKHRGYVKYRLGDKLGARADAEKAVSFRPMRVAAANHCSSLLGMQPVEFLGYSFT